MDEVWVGLLFVSGIWRPSILSSVYLIFAFWLVCKLIFREENPKNPYPWVLIYSGGICIAKIILVLIIRSACCDSYFKDFDELNRLFGIFAKSHTDTFGNYIDSVLPDPFALIVGILGWCMAKRKEQRLKTARRWLFIGVFSLIATALVNVTCFNLTYLLMGITSLLFWGYKIRFPIQKILLKISVLLTGLQISFSCLYIMNLHAYIPSDIGDIIGITTKYHTVPLDLIGTFLRLMICIFYARPTENGYFFTYDENNLVDDDCIPPIITVEDIKTVSLNIINPENADPPIRITAEELKEKLLLHDDDSSKISPSINTTQRNFIEDVNSRVPFVTVFFIARVLIFLWIMRYHSFFNLSILLWLFYTIIDPSVKRIIQITAIVLVPSMVVNMVIFYIYIMLGKETNIYFTVGSSIFQYLSIPWLVLMILLLIFAIYKFVLDKDVLQRAEELQASRVLWIIFIQNIDKGVLFILFCIGLYEINIIHSIFLLICISLILNLFRVRRAWIVLVLYTQSVIFIRYLWYLIIFLVKDLEQYNRYYKLIGLPLPITNVYYIWRSEFYYDSVLWIMLLFESLQLQVFRSIAYNMFVNPSELINRWPKTCMLVTRIYRFFLDYEIWVVYVILYMIISLSMLNVLNCLRFILLLGYLMLHLYSSELEEGLKKVKKSWWVITYYSGMVMAVRYIYQFHGFFDYDELSWMKVLGITVLKKGDLYISMISDCLQLVCTVLTLKSLGEQEHIDNFSQKNENQTQDMGLLRMIVYIGGSRTHEQLFSSLFGIFSYAFNFLIFIVVFLLSIYWKLSLSMLILNFIVSLQLIELARFYCLNVLKGIIPHQELETDIRITLWNKLTFLVVIYNIIQYLGFLFTYEFEHKYEIEWWYYFAGFLRADDEILFSKIYGYAIMLLICILERHSLEYLNENKFENTYQPKAKTFTKNILTTFRFIFESITPTSMLFLSLYKLTFVSIIYGLAVFVGIGLIRSPINRARFFNIVIVMMILAQYGLILSNISNDIAPQDIYITPPVDIPWYKKLPDLSRDMKIFMNLGTERHQLNSVIVDMVFVLLNHLYIRYFILSLLPKTDENPEIIKMRTKAKWYKLTKKIGFIIYRTSKIVILIVVLILFVEQTGILTEICMISILICIFKANDFLKINSDYDFVSKANRSFVLPFMSFIFLIEIIYQLPFDKIHPDAHYSWSYALGLYRLWSAGENDDPRNIEVKKTRTYSRVMIFFLMYLLYILDHDQSFKKYSTKKRKSDKLNALSIGLELAQSFNDMRIEKYNKMKIRKTKLQEGLDKLINIVSKWSERFHDIGDKTRTINYNRGVRERPRFSTRYSFYSRNVTQDAKDKEPSNMWLQKFLMKKINPVFFRRILFKLRNRNIKEMTPILPVKSESISGNIHESRVKSFEEFKKEDTEDELFHIVPDFVEEPDKEWLNDNREAKILKTRNEKQMNLYLSYKEYFVLIICAIISCSDIITYISFFINHIVYGSLISMVYPISVLGYALLENPRPTAKYWRVMLIYTECVILAKMFMVCNIWETIFGADFLRDYKDIANIGINRPENTYSQTILHYTIWDIICILTILLHEYFLLCIGLYPSSEYDIESLHEGLLRYYFQQGIRVPVRKGSFQSDIDSNHPSFFSGFKKFLFRLFPNQPEEKPGKDYYLLIIIVQFIILGYLLIFYTKMDGEYNNATDSFLSSTFSGYMVIALVVHLFIMVLDKYFYLSRSSSAISLIISVNAQQSGVTVDEDIHRGLKFVKSTCLKLGMHIFLLLTIHGLVFWYFPMSANHNLTQNYYCNDIFDYQHCYNYQLSWALKIFYIIYLFYFFFNAIQLRDGMPLFKKGAMKIMQKYTYFHLVLFYIYMALPFLYELRTIAYWSFTKTSLNLYSWFKLDDIYGKIFVRKVTWKANKHRKTGTAFQWYMKILSGFCLIFIIILIIVLPLFLFSSLDPLMKQNPVRNVELSIGIIVNNNYFTLFETGHTIRIEEVSYQDWEKLELRNYRGIVNNDRKNARRVYIPISSDGMWSLNPDSQAVLCQNLDNTMHSKYPKITMKLQLNIERDEPAHKNKIKISTNIPIRLLSTIQDIYIATCSNNPSSSNTYFMYGDFHPQIIKLASVGEDPDRLLYEINDLSHNLYLRRTFSRELSMYYWSAFLYDGNEPIEDKDICLGNSTDTNACNLNYIIISDEYSPATFNLSALTFYVSVVYLIARLLRSVTGNAADNLTMTEIQNPRYLINLCEGIYVARMTGDLVREETLYYELMDIMRSPELIKMVTGRSAKSKTD